MTTLLTTHLEMASPLARTAVVIDPSDHQLRPLANYTSRIPSRVPGKRLNCATLWRWALDGRLRTVQIGGGRFTCDAWVWEFVHRKRAPISPEVRAELDSIGANPSRPYQPLSPEERARIAADLAPPARRRRMLAELERGHPGK